MDTRRWLFMRSWCAPLRKTLEIELHDLTCEVESVYTGLGVRLPLKKEAAPRTALLGV